jgi:type II secretory pathway component GspD/PulD (secretin)
MIFLSFKIIAGEAVAIIALVASSAIISVNTQSNQIIIGGNKSKRFKARFLIAELDKDQGGTGDTSVIYLKYANAKDILPILQGVISGKIAKGKATAVNIQADEATNAIIATASPAIILKLKKIITSLSSSAIKKRALKRLLLLPPIIIWLLCVLTLIINVLPVFFNNNDLTIFATP